MFIGSHVYIERICLVSRIPFLTRQILGPQVCEALSGLLDRCCCAGVRVVILRSSSGQRRWEGRGGGGVGSEFGAVSGT